MAENFKEANQERFSGFSGEYDLFRPVPPVIIPQILKRYEKFSGGGVIADVGCGTGLSTLIWENQAGKIYGFEPNADMINEAKKKSLKQIEFQQAFSDDLPLEDSSVDIVTCSQSFHWMEPISTLKEFSRILKPEGVLAVYDCDWPPSLNREVEEAYQSLFKSVFEHFSDLPDDGTKARSWSKSGHYENISNSGYFSFLKEFVFHSIEKCDAKRYIGIASSQGSLQTFLKSGDKEIKDALLDFETKVRNSLGSETHDVFINYRMIIAAK